MAGYIQFSVAGAIDRPGGILEATKDENAVLFERSQQPAFEKLRRLVETHISSPKHEVTASGSVGEELERLGTLLEKGLLTRTEFDEMKRRLLAS